MRTFAVGFLFGGIIALSIESRSRADDETLPLPLNTVDKTSSQQRYRDTTQEDMIKASRVQRAKIVAANNLAIATMNRWSGINPGRPQVNSGYQFLAPPRVSYRWFGPAQPTYIYPYGLPLP